MLRKVFLFVCFFCKFECTYWRAPLLGFLLSLACSLSFGERRSKPTGKFVACLLTWLTLSPEIMVEFNFTQIQVQFHTGTLKTRMQHPSELGGFQRNRSPPSLLLNEINYLIVQSVRGRLHILSHTLFLKPPHGLHRHWKNKVTNKKKRLRRYKPFNDRVNPKEKNEEEEKPLTSTLFYFNRTILLWHSFRRSC